VRIDGAVAVVTGGAGSMGTEIARTLAGRGTTVARWDVDSDDSDVQKCDVSDPEAVEAAFDETTDRHGTPTILINAAGVSGGRSPWAPDVIEEAADPFSADAWLGVLSSREAWRAVFDVNVMGVVNTSRSFARRVSKERAKGGIVNITSVGADTLSDPELTAYSASKSAVNAITRISAANFAPIGIRVNAVAPGMMEGRMKMSGVAPGLTRRADPPDMLALGCALTPLENRPVRPRDIAAAVLGFLESDFVTGQVITVDGGLMLRSSAQNLNRATPAYLREKG
jgi:NAD(P)-dependent dehydrogenase (short-subunit alcohol dehydrogenase family)